MKEFKNYDDVFFRDLTACLLDTIDGQLTWVNRFSTGDVQVRVPIFYSMTGDENFLLDSFSDDVVSDARYVELNTSMIPRGHVTLTSSSIKSDEFANPNVWLKWIREDKEEIKRMLTRVRAIPLSVKYDLQILVKSEIDSFKCQEAIMNMFWLYKYMNFEHNFMYIDAVFVTPDDSTVEITREQNLSSDNMIKITTSFEIHTYYPAVRPDAYDFKKNRIATDGITSDDNLSGLLGDENLLVPKRVKWRNHYNRTTGFGDVSGNYIGGSFVVDNTGEVILIIEDINGSAFKISRTYKLKDTINIADIKRSAAQNEIDNFVLSINSNYSLLNATYTNIANSIKDLEINITYYNIGTVSVIDYTTPFNKTVEFWKVMTYSVTDCYNATLGMTSSSTNLVLNYVDSTNEEFIGGNNIYNQQFLIQLGITKA